MSDMPLIQPGQSPSFRILLRLKLSILRNRLRQLTDQTPLQLLMVLAFLAVIWLGLFMVFDYVLMFIRRFEKEAIIALPYVFHIFFFSMTLLLAISTAVLVYGGLFAREEPTFLLTTPNSPRNIVSIVYLESLFFSSWSLLLLGIPLMLAIGKVQGLPWHFYLTFAVAFLGFIPIPGAIGLVMALAVARFLPHLAKRTLVIVTSGIVLLGIYWWLRAWMTTSQNGLSQEFVRRVLGELAYIKSALLPSAWVSKAIQFSIQDNPLEAAFYLAVTVSTGVFLSWWSTVFVGSKFARAFGSAQSAATQTRRYSGWASAALTRVMFFYLPQRLRGVILKDVRHFLRDPLQWTQLAILFGLLALYLFYLPRTHPYGFEGGFQKVLCFMNFIAITLILSTFTSRFVFPMISLEGKQIWLVGLWPISRREVVWGKFFYALTVTACAALPVTILSINAVEAHGSLGWIQLLLTLASCFGLCGLAIGLGARFPNYKEPNANRISSGLGGTLNLIASVALVALNGVFFGAVCFYSQQAESDGAELTAKIIGLSSLGFLSGVGAGTAAIMVGVRRFRAQEF